MTTGVWMLARQIVARGLAGRLTTVRALMREVKAHGFTSEANREVLWRWTDEGTVIEFHAGLLGLSLRVHAMRTWFGASGVPLSREWLTARELAGLGLPDWPKTAAGVEAKMKRAGLRDPAARNKLWRMRDMPGRGGPAAEYAVAQLPEGDREAVREALRVLMDQPLSDFGQAA